jgi:hypothetical protein
MYTARAAALTIRIGVLFVALAASSAEAGCGCDKPPPPPAQVRPNVAYTGVSISFFSPRLGVGQQYLVTFTNGISGTSASVSGEVVSRRDLADNVHKPQLIVPLPRLPVGPWSMRGGSRCGGA